MKQINIKQTLMLNVLFGVRSKNCRVMSMEKHQQWKDK